MTVTAHFLIILLNLLRDSDVILLNQLASKSYQTLLPQT